MLVLNIPEIKRKKQCCLFSLYVALMIWPSLFLFLRKNCFQAKPFYLQFCSAAGLLVSRVIYLYYLYWKCVSL